MPPSEKPTFQQFKEIKAAVLNQLVKIIPSMFVGTNPIKVTQYGDRIAIAISNQALINNGVGKNFRVKSVEVDFLICRGWDGRTEGTEDVKVALPYLMRKSPFDGTGGRDGFTYVYSSNTERVSTKTADSSTEDQELIPRYVINDEITAMKTIAGSTGVFTDGLTKPITWIDLNLDNRGFKEKST